jgi:hypothetical protein
LVVNPAVNTWSRTDGSMPTPLSHTRSWAHRPAGGACGSESRSYWTHVSVAMITVPPSVTASALLLIDTPRSVRTFGSCAAVPVGPPMTTTLRERMVCAAMPPACPSSTNVPRASGAEAEAVHEDEPVVVVRPSPERDQRAAGRAGDLGHHRCADAGDARAEADGSGDRPQSDLAVARPGPADTVVRLLRERLQLREQQCVAPIRGGAQHRGGGGPRLRVQHRHVSITALDSKVWAARRLYWSKLLKEQLTSHSAIIV